MYLVGSLERWNDGKKAEEAVRVKHTIDTYSPKAKAEREALKLERIPENENEYHKVYVDYTLTV